ncbi:Small subunit (SSU) processome component [Mycoemilia scoparia]|uniref:Small subunit (SSU) processome component n=1 Tax=Mycoemilia scoparia TaxID=417184 RepID=A0A9W8A8N1_9FUNG|nr:Small subunit (SSU) processome component [Mycoemilia scoparia]
MVKRSGSTKKPKAHSSALYDNTVIRERPMYAFDQGRKAADGNVNYLALVNQTVDRHRLRIFDVHNSAAIGELKASNDQEKLKRFTCIEFGLVRSDVIKETKSKKRKSDATSKNQTKTLLAAIGLQDGSIALYSPAQNKIISQLDGGHTMAVQDITFGESADRKQPRCWSCDTTGKIVEWDLLSNTIVSHFKTSLTGVSRIQIDSKGKRLAVASHSVEIVDLASKSTSCSFTGHGSNITDLLWGPGEKSIITAAGSDRFVYVWPARDENDGKTGAKPAVAALVMDSDVLTIDVSDNGSVIAMVEDGSAGVWYNIASKSNIAKLISEKSKKPLSESPDTKIEIKSKDSNVVPIILARFWQQSGSSQSALLVYGNLLKPVFETVVLTDENNSENIPALMELERDTQNNLLMNNGNAQSQAAQNLQNSVKTYDESQATVLGPINMDPVGASTKSLVPTLEDRMKEMGLIDQPNKLSSESATADGAIIDGQKKGPTPKATSLVRVLVQALHSQDNPLLETVLSNSSRSTVVRETVNRLPAAYVLPFIQQLFIRFQSSPLRANELIPWIRALLITHSAYLASVPQLVKQLAAFYQVIDSRLSVNNKLLRLQGRVDMLEQQIRARSEQSKGQGLDSERSGDQSQALNVYVEGEEDEDEDTDMMDEEHPMLDGESTTDGSDIGAEWTDRSEDEDSDSQDSDREDDDSDDESASDLEHRQARGLFNRLPNQISKRAFATINKYGACNISKNAMLRSNKFNNANPIIANKYEIYNGRSITAKSNKAMNRWYSSESVEEPEADETSIGEKPEGVRDEMWQVYADCMDRLSDINAKHLLPRQSTLENYLMKVSSLEELEIGVKLMERWRLSPLVMNEKITHYFVDAAERAGTPEIATKVILDRWKYKQFPTKLSMAKLIRLLGTKGKKAVQLEGVESETAKGLLSSIYMLFDSYEEFGIEQDAMGYGETIEASIDIGSDEGWKLAESLAKEAAGEFNPPRLTFEAIHALKRAYSARGDTDSALKYALLIKEHNIGQSKRPAIHFDKNGELCMSLK